MDEGMMIRGPLYGGIGGFTPRTANFSGAQRIVEAHGRHLDAALSRRVFFAAKQAAGAWSVALNTTHTGFVLSNPVGSQVYLIPLQVGFAHTVAPAAIASIGLFGGFDPAGIVTHTTPLTPLSTFLGSNQLTGQGKADEAATLVGTPRWCHQLLGGFTAAALPSSALNMAHLDGIFVIPPGGYLGIGTLTAVTGLAAMIWEEIPIISIP